MIHDSLSYTIFSYLNKHYINMEVGRYIYNGLISKVPIYNVHLYPLFLLYIIIYILNILGIYTYSYI